MLAVRAGLISLAFLVLLVAGCSSTLESQIPGTYEYHDSLFDLEKVFRSDGRVDTYDENGLLEEVLETWKLIDGELHVVFPDGDSMIFTRQPSGDITLIAWLQKGVRDDTLPPEDQKIWTRKSSMLGYIGIIGAVVAGLVLLFAWKKPGNN